MSCLYILEINPLSIDSFANIFSYSEGCLFILFIVSFAVQKLLSFIGSHLFIYVFISITLGGGSKKILLWLLVMLSIFSYVFLPFVCLLWRNSIQDLCLSLLGYYYYYYYCYKVKGVPYIFWILTSYQIRDM